MNWIDYISDSVHVMDILIHEAEAELERRKNAKK